MKTKLILSLIISLVFVSLCFAQAPSQLFQQALLKENGEGNLKAAVELYEKIVNDSDADRSLRAKAQLHIGMCWEKMGKREALAAYRQVIEKFSDEKEQTNLALQAISRLEANKELTGGKPTPQKLITVPYRGTDAGTISPSGRYLAYGTAFNYDVYDFVSNETFQATFGNLCYSLFWSPDEKYIAFSDWEQGIKIKQLEAKKSKFLTHGKEDYIIRWTNDNKIYYVSFENKISKLFETDIAGTKHRLITKFHEDSVITDISPDGRLLAFRVKKEKWIKDLKTGEIFQTDYNDGWSPDGRFMVGNFKKNDTHSIKVVRTGADGLPKGNPVSLVSSISPVLRYSIRWTSKNELCFGQQKLDEKMVICDPSFQDCKDLGPSQGEKSDAFWSPDGKSVLFVSNLFKNDDLWLTPLEGGKLVQLTNTLKLSEGTPAWSHDGKKVAYVLRKYGHSSFPGTLHLLYLATNETKQLIPWDGNFHGLCFSPDDRFILFSYSVPKGRKVTNPMPEISEGRAQIYKLNLENNKVDIFLKNSTNSDFVTYRWTPDGKKFIYVKTTFDIEKDFSSSIWLYEPQKESKILIEIKNSWISFQGFTPDSKHIYYSAYKRDVEKETYYKLPIEGGEPSSYATSEEISINQWSPDNSKVICTRGKEETEFWLVKNIEEAFNK